MEPQALRRWIRGQRKAQDRQRLERIARPAVPSTSFAIALSLISMRAGVDGWPATPSERDRLEDQQGYERWSRLRARLGTR